MSAAPLRLVAAEPDWREALAAAIRPEFHVPAYEPDPDDPWLYGPHCAVAGCELPIRRPLNGRGGVYVCNGHLHNYRDRGAATWRRGWLQRGRCAPNAVVALRTDLVSAGRLRSSCATACSAGTTASTSWCSTAAGGPVCCCIWSAPA